MIDITTAKLILFLNYIQDCNRLIRFFKNIHVCYTYNFIVLSEKIVSTLFYNMLKKSRLPRMILGGRLPI